MEIDVIIQSTIVMLEIVLKLILLHLPYFLSMLALGLLVGIILGFVGLRIGKKSGVFSNESKSKTSSFLNKAYMPLMFFGILFFSLIFSGHYAIKRILSSEIESKVDVTFQYLNTTYLQDPEFRGEMYKISKMVSEGGDFVDDINHALVAGSMQVVTVQMGEKFMGSKANKWINVESIQNKLLEYEKGAVFYIFAKAGKMIASEEMESLESFDEAFEAWLNSDFDSIALGIKESFSKLIYNYTKMPVFFMFLVFYIIGLVMILIPIIHFWIYKYREKRALKKMADTQLESIAIQDDPLSKERE